LGAGAQDFVPLQAIFGGTTTLIRSFLMFVQTVAGRSRNSDAGNRYFRYEVAGLQQNPAMEGIAYDVRPSGNVVITVPFNRMNEEMQRITRMGGVIVGIQAAVTPEAIAPE
jgi:phycocyanin-associated, rod